MRSPEPRRTVGRLDCPAGPAAIGPCDGGELRVTANAQELDWVEGRSPGVSAAATWQDTISALAAAHDLSASRYLPIGTRITVSAGKGMASATIQDAPITTAGAVRWHGWQDVSFQSDGELLSFDVPQNPATMLSSDSADYAPAASIRGVAVTLGCASGAHQYGFAFRTDPAGKWLFGESAG